MLRALPTRWDIEALILRLEETHRQDIQAVRSEIHTLTERVSAGEESASSVEQRVGALEKAQTIQATTAADLQLHLEELEDRSRRNNLRLGGRPESSGVEDLQVTVNAIFQVVLKSSQKTVELDRIHRAVGPRSNDPERPRDFVCRIHHYPELILRTAWEAGDIYFNRALIKILPD